MFQLSLNDIMMLFIVICVFIIGIIGLIMYLMNIQYQKRILETKLNELSLLQQHNSKQIIHSPKHTHTYHNIHNTNEHTSTTITPSLSLQGVPINIPTRGELGEYKRLGMLSSVSDEKISPKRLLPLFGRKTHPGSSKWNYYTTSDAYHFIQLPLTKEKKDCMGEYGCEEIYNDDELFIEEYNETFRVKMYQTDTLRYIPYV